MEIILFSNFKCTAVYEASDVLMRQATVTMICIAIKRHVNDLFTNRFTCMKLQITCYLYLKTNKFQMFPPAYSLPRMCARTIVC